MPTQMPLCSSLLISDGTGPLPQPLSTSTVFYSSYFYGLTLPEWVSWAELHHSMCCKVELNCLQVAT